MNIAVKNYRCFPGPEPATISLAKYFIALIGSNNSGKSSLLRLFYELRPLFASLAEDRNFFIKLMKGASEPLHCLLNDYNELFSNINNEDIELSLLFQEGELRCSRDTQAPSKLTLTIGRQDQGIKARIETRGQDYPPNRDYTFAGGGEEIFLAQNGKLLIDLTQLFSTLHSLSNTTYFGSFRNAINVGGKENYYDISVGETFIRSWNDWKTGGNKANRDQAIALIDILRVQFAYDRLDISATSDNKSLVFAINGRSFTLQEMGSGIAQFLLVLGNAAIKRPHYILIDEPELNLHPSLQRDFLIALAEYAKKGVIFSTHSLGLARCDADEMYSVRRIEQGRSIVSKYLDTPSLAEFIGEMEYAGYKALGFNKLLLVEGPTDVKVYQHFLKLFLLDHEVVIIHLGGAGSINGNRDDELREMTRICPSENIYAVVDSERQSLDADPADNVVEFSSSCQRVGIQCTILNRRATENYFPSMAINKVLGSTWTEFGHFDKPANWSKNKNWKIARHMTKSDLDSTDIGQLLITMSRK